MRTPALKLLGLISGPVLMSVVLIWVAKQASADPPFVPESRSTPMWLWVVLLCVSIVTLALAARFADLNVWSLHGLYRERLTNAFSLERVAAAPGSPTAVGDWDVQVRTEPLALTASQPPDFPILTVCAAVNISDYGVVPTGWFADTFTFSSDHISLGDRVTVPTAWYQQQCLDRDAILSLMSAVSISAAAVGPSMGRQTRAPLRFLMALANIRLGVWLPNPARVRSRSLDPGRLSRRLRARTRLPQPPSRTAVVTDWCARKLRFGAWRVRADINKNPSIVYLAFEMLESTTRVRRSST